MTEGQPIRQEPQALNHQFHALYDLLPERGLRWVHRETTELEQSILGLSSIAERIIPENSELKDKILGGIRDLLSQAPITYSFKNRIEEVFEGLWENGTWKNDEEPDDRFQKALFGDKFDSMSYRDFVYDTIILNSMDGGGIFDSDDAERIERIAYQRDFVGSLATNELFQRFYRNLNADGGNNGEYKPNPESRRAKEIQRWRQEFIQRYQEEP